MFPSTKNKKECIKKEKKRKRINVIYRIIHRLTVQTNYNTHAGVLNLSSNCSSMA